MSSNELVQRFLVAELRSSNELVQCFLVAELRNTDFDTLVDEWNKAVVDSCPEQRIEKQIGEIVARTTCWDALVKMWKSVKSGTRLEQLIEKQMEKVLPEILTDDATNWYRLVEMLGNNRLGSRPEQLIQKRMEKVYEATVVAITDADSIPEWLTNLMQTYADRSIWPNYLNKTILINRLIEMVQ